MQKIREFLEMHAFGVCSSIGERLGIASTRIRMWFIYISFLQFNLLCAQVTSDFGFINETNPNSIIIEEFVKTNVPKPKAVVALVKKVAFPTF